MVDDVRAGVRLGLDIGAKRVGVARCDREGLVAVPVTVLDATSDWHGELRTLLDEFEVMEVVVGIPVSLRGAEEQAAEAMREQIRRLKDAFPGLPMRGVDERLTSALALRQLRDAGHTTKTARPQVDALAAAGILDFALETERRTGSPAGELL